MDGSTTSSPDLDGSQHCCGPINHLVYTLTNPKAGEEGSWRRDGISGLQRTFPLRVSAARMSPQTHLPLTPVCSAQGFSAAVTL